METINEIIDKYGDSVSYRDSPDTTDTAYTRDSVIEIIKEAINADREHLLNYVTAILYRSENDEKMDSAIVDEHSIINAPI